MDVTLVMFKADRTRRDFAVRKDRIVIGRTNTCDIRIPLSSVSRQHCEIVIGDEEISVRDLGSSNGTYLNTKRIQQAALKAGDQLVVGPVVLTVVVDQEPSDIEPVPSPLDPGIWAKMCSGGSAGKVLDDSFDDLDEVTAMGLEDSDASDELPMLGKDDEDQ